MTDTTHTRDLRSDLAIVEGATKGPWNYEACRDHIGLDGLSCWGLRSSDGSRIEEPQDQRAIALAGTHAREWLQRAIEAEEVCLALDTAITEPTKWGVSDAATAIQALAARIRAGREKGATP